MTASTRIKAKNTIVLPGVDIANEVALINQGHARLVGTSRYQINNRVYVVKPDGGTYPESGERVANVSPFAMALLRDMIANRHDPEAIAGLIQRNRRYTDDVVEEATWLFNLWKRDK